MTALAAARRLEERIADLVPDLDAALAGEPDALTGAILRRCADALADAAFELRAHAPEPARGPVARLRALIARSCLPAPPGWDVTGHVSPTDRDLPPAVVVDLAIPRRPS